MSRYKPLFAVAPAVRSVMIEIYPTDGRHRDDIAWVHKVYPIVALEWATDAAAAAPCCRPLFFMPHLNGAAVCGPDDLDETALTCCAVSCPWPESEDDERLRPYIEALTATAKVITDGTKKGVSR